MTSRVNSPSPLVDPSCWEFRIVSLLGTAESELLLLSLSFFFNLPRTDYSLKKSLYIASIYNLNKQFLSKLLKE